MLLALLLLLTIQQAPSCTDVEVCRAEALIAHAQQDFERFHDLAWAAYRKGEPNDPELMLLVARAQSLSGRPGDALVMLERIAALGAATDAATSDDFARVRALPRWPDVEAKLVAAQQGTPASDAPLAKEPASAFAKASADKSGSAKASASAKATADRSGSAKATADKSGAAKATANRSGSAKASASAKATADRPAEKPAEKRADEPSPKAPASPLKFTTLLTPSAMAYDAVSKRFIIADRQARRIAVIDEHSRQVATFIGAQGALGDIGGIAIDPQVGDLWVVSSEGASATLHKVQLISGRVLSTSAISGPDASIVALTFVKGAGLVIADASGILWRLRPSGRAEKLLALEYVPRAVASDAEGRLYVSAGGPRLARFAVTPSLRRTGVVEMEDGVPSDMPFAVAGGRLHVIVPSGGDYEIRSIRIR